MRSKALRGLDAEAANRVAIGLADVARRLREVIAALDQRAPRADRAAEAAIARDAAILREKAVNRLAEIAEQTTAALDETHDRVG